tara:strand:- start:1351 stop:1776 length:426 start_codon:yes stop_codon:yes gene_type:complete
MKDILFKSNKIEIRKSPIDGYGVFAKEDIVKNELLEECHYFKLKDGFSSEIETYSYTWPKKRNDANQNRKFDFRTIVFGYASVYNTSKTFDTKNINWYTDGDIYVFETIRDIKKDEELLIYYGDSFWNWYYNDRNNTTGDN